MGLVPASKVTFVKLAVPLTSRFVPRSFVPSKNDIAPAGKPAPGASALTVAVKTTAWPATAGLTLETNMLVVAAWVTTWFVAEAVLPR